MIGDSSEMIIEFLCPIFSDISLSLVKQHQPIAENLMEHCREYIGRINSYQVPIIGPYINTGSVDSSGEVTDLWLKVAFS